jgi:hypothetical protein
MELVVFQMSTEVSKNLHTWIIQELHLHADIADTEIEKVEVEKEEM